MRTMRDILTDFHSNRTPADLLEVCETYAKESGLDFERDCFVRIEGQGNNAGFAEVNFHLGDEDVKIAMRNKRGGDYLLIEWNGSRIFESDFTGKANEIVRYDEEKMPAFASKHFVLMAMLNRQGQKEPDLQASRLQEDYERES